MIEQNADPVTVKPADTQANEVHDSMELIEGRVDAISLVSRVISMVPFTSRASAVISVVSCKLP